MVDGEVSASVTAVAEQPKKTGEASEGGLMSSYSIPKLLTVGQLAEQLQVPVATIYYWVHRNEIPHMKVGRHLRFDIVAVLKHFNATTHHHAAACQVPAKKLSVDLRSLKTRFARPVVAPTQE